MYFLPVSRLFTTNFWVIGHNSSMPITDVNQDSRSTLDHLKAKHRPTVEHFVSTHHKGLIGKLQKNGLSLENAQDLAAETWSVFFQKLDDFRGDSSLSSFLFGILHNKYREHLRKKGKMTLYSNASDLLDSNFNENGMWAYKPLAPDHFVEALELKNNFSDCLEILTEKQKKIFLMKVVESRNYHSLSETLQMSVTNLKVIIHRARNQVRRCVEGSVA